MSHVARINETSLVTCQFTQVISSTSAAWPWTTDNDIVSQFIRAGENGTPQKQFLVLSSFHCAAVELNGLIFIFVWSSPLFWGLAVRRLAKRVWHSLLMV